MEIESRYPVQNDHAGQLIDRFTTRSLRDNERVLDAAGRHGLTLVHVSSPDHPLQATEKLIDIVKAKPEPR